MKKRSLTGPMRWHELILRAELNGTAKALLFACIAWLDWNDTSKDSLRPSVPSLAKGSGLSERTVQRTLERLAKLSVVHYLQRGHGGTIGDGHPQTNTIRIDADALHALDREGESGRQPDTDDAESRQGRQPVTTPPSDMHHPSGTTSGGGCQSDGRSNHQQTIDQTKEHTHKQGLRASVPDSSFDDFWREYPKRTGIRAARASWDRAISSGADPQTIIEAAREYAGSDAGSKLRYATAPSAWLDRGCWDDDRAAWATSERPHRDWATDWSRE